MDQNEGRSASHEDDGWGGANWPNLTIAQKVTESVLSHFLMHRESVLKKLEHARDATIQTLQEIDGIRDDMQQDSLHIDGEMKELHALKTYDALWDHIIGSFRLAGISEDDLAKIEEVLCSIPAAIDRHYQCLVRQDEALSTLIDKLGSEEYKRAFALVREVQSRPNPMSGLGPEEYNIKPAQNAVAPIEEVHIFTNVTMRPERKKS